MAGLAVVVTVVGAFLSKDNWRGIHLRKTAKGVTMRRVSLVLLVMAFCMMMLGCSSQATQASQTAQGGSSAAETSSSAAAVDKSELYSLVKEVTDAGADELTSTYTTSSLSEYIDAISAGSDLLNDDTVTQDEVDSAVANIKSKKNALEEKVQPVTITGSGDDVVSIPSELSACLVHAENNGDSNFAIWTDDSNMNHIDLLVNTIGSYSGTTTTALGKGDAAYLEITSSGDWSITLSPLSEARRIQNGEQIAGDEIVYISTDGAAKLTITNSGDHNFVVRGVDSNGSVSLLVNEIGSYSGSVANRGYFMLIVESGGVWSVSW